MERRRRGVALAAGWHLSQRVGVTVVHHVEATIHVHAHRPIVTALLRVVAQHACEVPADGTGLVAPSKVPAPDPRSSSPSGSLDATQSARGDQLSTRSMHGGQSAEERRTRASQMRIKLCAAAVDRVASRVARGKATWGAETTASGGGTCTCGISGDRSTAPRVSDRPPPSPPAGASSSRP
jgi:hypothetical protein